MSEMDYLFQVLRHATFLSLLDTGYLFLRRVCRVPCVCLTVYVPKYEYLPMSTLYSYSELKKFFSRTQCALAAEATYVLHNYR